MGRKWNRRREKACTHYSVTQLGAVCILFMYKLHFVNFILINEDDNDHDDDDEFDNTACSETGPSGGGGRSGHVGGGVSK